MLELSFEGESPDPTALAKRWHSILDEAKGVVEVLPAEELGKCVLFRDGTLYRSDSSELKKDRDHLLFHSGSIRGALPQIVEGR